jgi:hypothetical protein
VERKVEHVRARVRRQLALGRTVLFMGAGFSASACDPEGRPLPLGDDLASELFRLCFPGEPRDGSQLQDLFHHAMRRHRDELEALLRERLAVAERSLPDWYAHWFAQPWLRGYTLNVDTIELGIARRFPTERPPIVISALRDSDPEIPSGALPIVHLNGILEDGCGGLTFATSQYGQRLATRDRWYAQLARDLIEHPFVFVGTRLDEAPLWQHLEGGELLERSRADDAPRSLLVAPELDRARRSLLEDVGIDWVCASAEEFARVCLDARG